MADNKKETLVNDTANIQKTDWYDDISYNSLTNGSTNGDPVTGYRKDNFFNIKGKESITNGYPQGNPHYVQLNPGPLGEITIDDHNIRPVDAHLNPNANEKYFVPDPSGHFVKEVPQHIGENVDDPVYNEGKTKQLVRTSLKDEPTTAAVFSGATTRINPYDDKNTQEIIDSGTLSNYLEETHREKELGTYRKPPVSPLHPFTRLGEKDNQFTAQEAIFNTYNRTKTPIADIEWRKGFRHIFITRPECYLMYNNNGIGLCDQAYYDDDFSSAYTRMPHIIKLLSPWYVSGTFPTKSPTNSNWNFLLSNRVQGLSVAPTTMTINENVSKSTEGYTVTPAMHVESRQGSTIDLTFRDTKNLEVFETARLWMLYMYKRKKGIFAPPYNGYQKTNGYVEGIGENGLAFGSVDPGRLAFGGGNSFDPKYTRYHPYDRALEYCASLYDIITNETGTKILYWCKYYGIYPTSVSPTLANENNGPITELTTSITFKYHYRLENSNKTLVEFNHDAGLTDDIGKVNKSVTSESMSFLLRDEYDDPVMKKYIGAAGMFTGSPYIVMQLSRPDPLDKSNTIAVPNLRFMNVIDNTLDGAINMGITNTNINRSTNNVVGYL